MTTLDPARLKKLVLLLSSDQPGEVTAAAGAIGRLLNQAGATWHDLANRIAPARDAPPPPRRDDDGPPASWRPLVKKLLDHCPSLTAWEYEFLQSLRARRKPLTPKQSQALMTLLRKKGVRF